ncbi:MAG TPA: FeoA family protein [Phycisphaerales bacterium]|nr:FeoA family protein [Phycisphaerales bacterium]
MAPAKHQTISLVSSCCGGACAHGQRPEPVRVRLSDAEVGDSGVVCHHNLDIRDAELLRAMGLRPRARVRVCKRGEPCIVEVLAGCGHGGGGIEDACSCRIGLAGSLARLVMIEPTAATPALAVV